MRAEREILLPLHRRRQADWIRDNAALIKAYSACTAFVIGSPLVRGALTAILWLQPMPSPYTVLATLALAQAWALEQLSRFRVLSKQAWRPAGSR
jgi:hypothetical protein